MKVERLAETLWRYEAQEPYLDGEEIPDGDGVIYEDLVRWSGEPHDGDCTGADKPCCCCLASQTLHKARWLAAQDLDGDESRELLELRCRATWLQENRDAWMRHSLRGGRSLTPDEKLAAARDDLLSSIDQAIQSYAEGHDAAGREALNHAREVVLELGKGSVGCSG
jgi:hypothetical protein